MPHQSWSPWCGFNKRSVHHSGLGTHALTERQEKASIGRKSNRDVVPPRKGRRRGEEQIIYRRHPRHTKHPSTLSYIFPAHHRAYYFMQSVFYLLMCFEDIDKLKRRFKWFQNWAMKNAIRDHTIKRRPRRRFLIFNVYEDIDWTILFKHVDCRRTKQRGLVLVNEQCKLNKIKLTNSLIFLNSALYDCARSTMSGVAGAAVYGADM